MRFFAFTKNSSRARVAEKKSITIGPLIECCPPADLKNRVQLIPLKEARDCRKIRLRTVIDSPEMRGEVGIWEDIYQSSPKSEDMLVKDSTSGYSSGSSSVSEADTSLAPEILDYYVCHKPYAPEDDSMIGVDQSALFAEIEGMLGEPVPAPIVEKKVAPVVQPVVQTKTTRQNKRAAIVRFEDTLIPLDVAMSRPDIRYRPEGYEMF